MEDDNAVNAEQLVEPAERAYEFNCGDANERTYAVLAHIASLSGTIGIPMGHVVGPLIIYLLFGKVSAFVEANAKESLNFQISLIIYIAISVLLLFLLIGFILLPAILIFGFVEVIIASVKARDGYSHRYPLCIRFIK